jgi:hypothetical protein
MHPRTVAAAPFGGGGGKKIGEDPGPGLGAWANGGGDGGAGSVPSGAGGGELGPRHASTIGSQIAFCAMTSWHEDGICGGQCRSWGSRGGLYVGPSWATTEMKMGCT